MAIVMWGERGLVATFFHDLDADATLGRWKQFLAAIQFQNAGPGIDWNRLTRVWAVVEPCFGPRGFGSPDCIVRLEFEVGPPAVLFFEAKVGIYAENTRLPAGRNVPGYNSSLNGQLELKHRLAMALEAYQQGVLRDLPWVVLTPYRHAVAPRYVVDEGVLRQIVPNLRGPGCRYLHVAITSDQVNPFTLPILAPFFPEIYTSAQAQDLWDLEKHRFGWIGWSSCYHQAQDWPRPSLFHATHELNQHYLARYVDVGAAPPAGEHAPGNWPANRAQQGVSVAFIPNIAENTTIHFSWKGNSCAIRDYMHEGQGMTPNAPDYRQTLAILPLIQREHLFGRTRPRVTDHPGWRQIITGFNNRWGINPQGALWPRR